jgi:hypothetical protein
VGCAASKRRSGDLTSFGQTLRHLLTEKSRQTAQQLGRQVVECGLDLLLRPGGIALLQGLKAETGIVVVLKFGPK